MASGNTVRVILRRIAEQLGLQKVHPHRFRHTFATWAIQSGAREIDVQMLLGHSDLAMVQRYSRTYTSEQAVKAHAGLSPVGQLEPVGAEAEAPEHAAAVEPESEDRAPGLPSEPERVSHTVPRTMDGVPLDVSPTGGKAEGIATKREQIRAGQTLVARYKKQQHSCEVVEHDGRLYFVLPKGRVFKRPSAAGKAVTGTATNGYRFWSIPDQPLAGQAERQQAARVAAEKAGQRTCQGSGPRCPERLRFSLPQLVLRFNWLRFLAPDTGEPGARPELDGSQNRYSPEDARFTAL